MNWTDKIDGAIAMNWQRARIALLALAAFVLLLVAGGLFGGAARAEGVGGKSAVAASPVPVGVVAAGSSWTGFHVGAALGGDWTRTEFTTNWDEGKSFSTENAIATVGFGWDLQVSNIVLGLMADVTASDFDHVQWQWFIGGRLGFLATPKTLVYGLVGYSEALDGQLAFKSLDTTRFDSIAGLTYGGGVEHVFANGWAVRGEYRYVQAGANAPDGKIDGLKDGSDVDTGSHQARIGIVKRF